MQEQLSLFEAATRRWVERVWEGVGAEQREAVLALLAQMSTTRLAQLSSPMTKEDNDDES